MQHNNIRYLGIELAKEKRYIKFFRFFFLLLFIVHSGNITLFNHTHVVNGVVIVHSHINIGEHTHVKQSLVTIFYLSNILTAGNFQSSFMPVLWLVLIGEIFVPAFSNVAAIAHGTVSLRAPPALF